MPTDLAPTIIIKSDRLNSEDLLSGPMTIRITNVQIKKGEEQPVAVSFEGDNGKPWYPCLSMRKVLIFIWGAEGDDYIGRSITIFRDPKVKWAGEEVGGIRISHMSNLKSELVLPLTVTRGRKSHYTVKPIGSDGREAPKEDTAQRWTKAFLAGIGKTDNVDAYISEKQARLDELKAKRPELYQQCRDAISDRLVQNDAFEPADDGDNF